VTRATLSRELVVNATTKPVAIAVPAAVAVAALLLGAPWLLPVAVVLYVALAASTLFDAKEAERVGRAAYERARATRPPARALPSGLAPELAALVEQAREEERRIARAIDDSELPLSEVSIEVEALTAEMERIARRAQTIAAYLAEQRPDAMRARRSALSRERGGSGDTIRARERAAAALEDRLRVGEALEGELERFEAEMEHLIASLGVVHGQVVRISVTDDAREQENVAGQVRALRERVGVLADGMREAVAELDERDPVGQRDRR
jgi:hypothetical protein